MHGVKNDGGVLAITWLGYRTAVACLGPLVVPAAVVLVPFGALMNASTALTIGDGGVIANGQLEAATAPGRSWLVWWLGLALTGGLASTFATASGVVLAAGALLDHPVTPRAAVGAVRRRLPLLVALTVAALMVVAAVLAAGIVLWRFGASLWVGLATIVLGALFVLPYVLVLPAAILERRSLWRAIGRARRVAAFRRSRFTAALILAAIVPAGAAALVSALVTWPLDGLWRTLVDETLRGVLLVMVVPFQATAVTVVFLNRSDVLGAWRPVTTQDADRDLVRGMLAEVTSPRPESPAGTGWRRARVLAPALALPGLLFTAYLWINPLSLPAFSDRAVRLGGVEYWGEPAVLHHDHNGRMIALVQGRGGDTSALVTCPDDACSGGADVRTDGPYAYAPQTDTTVVADGRLALATWEPSVGSDDWGLNVYG